jgi:acetyltransferase-like isoleucine patch superfamily enzyme
LHDKRAVADFDTSSFGVLDARVSPGRLFGRQEPMARSSVVEMPAFLPQISRIRTGLGRARALCRARRAGRRPGVHTADGVRFGRRVACHAGDGARIELGRNVEVAAGTTLIAQSGALLHVGDNVFIGSACTVAASSKIYIGAGSMLADLVTIRDHDHDPAFPPQAGHMLIGEVLIGERVWIGTKATIVRNCQEIGDDAVIRANALVDKPVVSGCLVGGVPAVVKRRDIRTSS